MLLVLVYQDPPEEVVRLGTARMLQYFSESYADALMTARVLLDLGDSGSGGGDGGDEGTGANGDVAARGSSSGASSPMNGHRAPSPAASSSAAAAAPDPATQRRQLYVTVTEAEINAAGWLTADPYVELSVDGSETKATPVVKRTWRPKWKKHNQFTFIASPISKVLITVKSKLVFR